MCKNCPNFVSFQRLHLFNFDLLLFFLYIVTLLHLEVFNLRTLLPDNETVIHWAHEDFKVLRVAVTGLQEEHNNNDESITESVFHDSRDIPRVACAVWLRYVGVFIPKHAEQTQDDTGLQERSSVHRQGIRQTRRSAYVPNRQR
jgi:hypothetical protein